MGKRDFKGHSRREFRPVGDTSREEAHREVEALREEIAHHEYLYYVEIGRFFERLAAQREKLSYEIDGIVVCRQFKPWHKVCSTEWIRNSRRRRRWPEEVRGNGPHGAIEGGSPLRWNLKNGGR